MTISANCYLKAVRRRMVFPCIITVKYRAIASYMDFDNFFDDFVSKLSSLFRTM